jgi:hypothetical protein
MLVRIEPLKSFIAARPWLRFYRHDNYSDVAGSTATELNEIINFGEVHTG